MIGLKDYKVSEGKGFYFVNLDELNLNLNDMLKRFDKFQEFCKRFHITNEELAEYVVKCCIPDKSLFEYSVYSHGNGYLVAEDGVYTEREVKQNGCIGKQINKYNVYIVPNTYCKLALNKIATKVMFDKFPFMEHKEFTKEVKHFNEKINNLPTDVNTLIGDIDADIVFENKLTIKDLIDIYTTNRDAAKLTKSESLFAIYGDGNIYLKINEYQSLYLKSDDFFNHDWVAVLEKEVSNLPLVDENGDRKPYEWFDGKQKDAPYINNEIVSRLAYYFHNFNTK